MVHWVRWFMTIFHDYWIVIRYLWLVNGWILSIFSRETLIFWSTSPPNHAARRVKKTDKVSAGLQWVDRNSRPEVKLGHFQGVRNRSVLNMISVLARISCPGALGYSNVTTSAARNQWKISAGTRIVTNCTTGNNPGNSYLHLGFRTKCGIFVGEVYAGSKLLKSQFDCIGPGLPILVDGWSTLFSWKSHP